MIFGMFALGLFLASGNLYKIIILSLFLNAPLLNPALVLALSRRKKFVSERQWKLFKVIFIIAIPYILPVCLLPSISSMIQYVAIFCTLSITTLFMTILFIFDNHSPLKNYTQIRKYCTIYYALMIIAGISTFWIPANMFA